MGERGIMKYAKIVVMLLVLTVAGCGMEVQKTPEAKYVAETKQMRLIKEHQTLQLEIMKVNREIAALQAEANKNIPTFDLTPAKKE